MKMITVSVQVRSLEGAEEFYGGALSLDTRRELDAVVVSVGTTRLELVENPDTAGSHHFAITIPSNKFDAAKAWLGQRSELLGTPETDEFECSPSWNARSLYFAGHGRSVLELIIRRDLDNAAAGPFVSADLLCISEVGVAVADLPAVVGLLTDEAEIVPYGGAAGSVFAPVGDAQGMLILVAPGRTWFPTADRASAESPVSITAAGGRPGTYPLGALGTLRVVA